MKGSSFLQVLKNAKQADSKRKPEKKFRVKGARARKLGQYTIWLLFAIMFVSYVFNAVNSAGGDIKEIVEIEPEKENMATGAAAVDFAKTFTNEYFTFSATGEGFTERSERLKSFLATGLDENAGLMIGQQEWNSSIKSVRVLQIEETGENKALIVLQVKQNLSKGDDKAATEQSFAVPVAFNKSFAVYEIPSFYAIPQVNEVITERLEGTPVTGTEEENVRNFLPTFFQSYAEDGPDKLSYFLQNGSLAQGLNGAMIFESIQDSIIVGGNKEYQISVGVVMREPKTDGLYLSKYLLTVKETDGHYIVTKLNEGVK